MVAVAVLHLCATLKGDAVVAGTVQVGWGIEIALLFGSETGQCVCSQLHESLGVRRVAANASGGDIVVALIDNESTLKRFFKDDKNQRVILRAENKKYKDIIRPSCTIQGVAQHVIKRV